MAKTYVTGQGETVDRACWKTYGKTSGLTEKVLSANPGLSALGPILPFGTIILMPDISTQETATQLVSLW